MPLPRFYVEAALALGARIPLPDAVSRHALGALRLKPGAEVMLFNGDGGEYPGVLEVKGGAAWVECRGRQTPERESPLDIWLAQGISAGERMDYTIQKAVELGVAGIVPLTMRRSVVRLDGERAEKRRRHWQAIAIAACEQSGRNRLPEVRPIMGFTDWLGRVKGEAATKLLLDPEGGSRLTELAKPAGQLWLLAGPEGGFDPEEAELARVSSFLPLRLGPRVLRTETAALAAMAAIQAVWGDF
ncbi:MAG: 16S rRNA (uracil(1498)-N(3))-methyltransferase [Hydrogenophilaceae bacterium]|nr:16S rRNA (uracil(1498)-N(3))-methyltransferase [Hydrogenophilaceae bacterium]